MKTQNSYPGRIGFFGGFSEVLNRLVPEGAIGPSKITWKVRRVKKSESDTRSYADQQRSAWASLIAKSQTHK
jgi:hypothetical protein